MKQWHKITGIGLAVPLLLGACVSTGTFNAYKDEVNLHRERSQIWAQEINTIVRNLSICIVDEPSCPYTDPITPPPPNSGW